MVPYTSKEFDCISVFTNIRTSKKPSPFLCCSYFMFMFYNRLNSCTLFRTLCNHMFIYMYIHVLIMALVKNMYTASLFFLLTKFLFKINSVSTKLQIGYYNLPFFLRKRKVAILLPCIVARCQKAE